MKRLAIVLACALSAGVLAGCGNSSSIEKRLMLNQQKQEMSLYL